MSLPFFLYFKKYQNILDIIYMETILIFIFLIIIAIALIILRPPKLIKKFRSNIMVVLGSGGHTTQMLYMMRTFNFSECKQLTFALASTDTTSQGKCKDFFTRQNIKFENIKWFRIPRSRQVKQSYITAIYSTIKSFISIFFNVILKKRNIDIVIMNGPGTCVPLAYTFFILNAFRITNTKIVFIQSWCRVNHISLTGKLLKPIAHNFIVHWDTLCKENNKAQYYGTLL